MKKFSQTVAFLAMTLLVNAASLRAQQDSQDAPLGDIAREQKKLREQAQKNNQPPKTITTDDIASGTSDTSHDSPPADKAKEPESKPDKDSPPSTAPETDAKGKAKPKRSLLDSRKESTPDGILIPAGTQIRVDANRQIVIVPVRVGFATLIPALSSVKLESARTYFDTTNVIDGVPVQGYSAYTTLTSVTVGAATYPLKTDVLPLLNGGTNSELVFTLREPVTLH